MDTKVISTITSHAPGYLDREKEKIVGFQTDKPFKRALMPYGGIRMAEKACHDNGYELDPLSYIPESMLSDQGILHHPQKDSQRRRF